MIRRVVTGPLGLKALFLGLVWRGVTDRDAALLLTALVACYAVRLIRGGLRERYIEPANEQAARQMGDVVDSHSIWFNGTRTRPETREQGIARLVTPYLTAGGKK